MRRFLVLSFAAVCLASPGVADDRQSFRDEWEIYRGFLKEPACGLAMKQESCIKALDTWRRDFMWATGTDVKVQNLGQMFLSLCFSTGCSDTVKVNPMLACAWATVRMKSGSPEAGGGDILFAKNACSNLSSDQLEVAEGQAQRLLRMLAESR